MRFISNDADVVAHVLAVEGADGDRLEDGVISAYESFITGCKTDSIWGAIKASCILAGARTLSGALVPLVGTAPTNNNFVSADYSRTLGPLSNGTTKRINSNRVDNADPQNSHHFAIFNTTALSAGRSFGGVSTGQTNLNFGNGRCRTTATLTMGSGPSIGFKGIARESSLIVRGRANNSNYQNTNLPSTAPVASSKGIFTRALTLSECDCRLSFYSIGENLDLAKLDARVSTLMTALTAAIP
jgi:hypothetical protein